MSILLERLTHVPLCSAPLKRTEGQVGSSSTGTDAHTSKMSSIPYPLLKGKTAIITGGTTGIGRGITIEYLRQGCNVAVNHLGLPGDDEHLQSLIAEAQEIRRTTEGSAAVSGELIDVRGDITDPMAMQQLVDATVQRFGQLDVLVANAGIFTPAAFLEMEPETLQRTVNVNVNGTFFSCQAASRQMVKQGRAGAIIAVSSISALQGGRYQTHYTPTKAAILSLIQSMGIALGEHGIRCNALMPGTVKSQLSDAEIGNKESRDKLVAKIPLGRPGEPQDIAGPAVFLACEAMSGWMTGSGLLVDGGMYSYLQ